MGGFGRAMGDLVPTSEDERARRGSRVSIDVFAVRAPGGCDESRPCGAFSLAFDSDVVGRG
jgi:hypothetical protein